MSHTPEVLRLLAALQKIAANGDFDEEPEPESYDDMESAYGNGMDVANWEAAQIAKAAITEVEADARLRAAAPKLLKAVNAALDFFNETRVGREWEEQGGTEPQELRAALAEVAGWPRTSMEPQDA